MFDAKHFVYILEDEYYQRAKVGGLKAASITVAANQDFHSAYRYVRDFVRRVNQQNNRFRLAIRVADIEKAYDEGKIALMMDFQDSQPLESDAGFVEVFYTLGVRCIQLAYFLGNVVGCGSGERWDYGLTYFGLDVLSELNRLNMLIDVSHCGHLTTMDAIQYSKSPVAMTHANSRTVCNHHRNKTDEELKALAEKGGVVGVETMPTHVSNKRDPTVEDLLNHIDYMTDLMGVDHVGIGLDLTDGFQENLAHWERYVESAFGQIKYTKQRFPDRFGVFEDFYNVRHCIHSYLDLPLLTQGLIARGYSDNEIQKILGKNWLNLLRRVIE